jgi:hypothetical protein
MLLCSPTFGGIFRQLTGQEPCFWKLLEGYTRLRRQELLRPIFTGPSDFLSFWWLTRLSEEFRHRYLLSSPSILVGMMWSK